VAETTPLSQITWRKNVARQSPEDTKPTSKLVSNIYTALKARGARRAPMARPLRAGAQPGKEI
jgi:hypothetical protein